MLVPFPLDRNFWMAPLVFESVLKSPYGQKSAEMLIQNCVKMSLVLYSLNFSLLY